MMESNLGSSFSWQTFNYTSVKNLSPDTGVWIVVRWVGPSTSAGVAYQSGDVADHFAAYAESSNGGSTWTQTNDAAIAHALYGTYTVPVTTSTAQTRATTLRVRLNLSSDAAAVLETSTRLMTEPVLVVNP